MKDKRIAPLNCRCGKYKSPYGDIWWEICFEHWGQKSWIEKLKKHFNGKFLLVEHDE